MRREIASLALDLGVASQRLRQGRALDESSRAALAELLLTAAMALHGVTPPARLGTDPQALVTTAVEIAREAGMAASDVVACVNDALERAVRPVGATA